MSRILDAVSIVMTCGDEIFAIQRQFFLKAFPGYWAFPGGKVEIGDETFSSGHKMIESLDHRLFGAAVREGKEEIGIDLREEISSGRVRSVDYLGLAITPDFNPYRFSTYFFRIDFTQKVTFEIDRNEARLAKWMKCSELLRQFNLGLVLAVPPVIKVIETLGRDPATRSIPDLNFSFNSVDEVPMIESLKSVRQIMPLSHTLPPASRTNAFLIGDGAAPKVLIDPSPQDDDEYRKFKNTLKAFKVDKIMLTHHHPDHYERSNQLARELRVPVLLSSYTFDRIVETTPDYFLGIKVTFLQEGDVLTKWLERDVLVYEIPGHDEGQLAVAPSDLSWFLAGDLFQGIGTVVIGGEEGDMKKYFQTLKRVITLNPRVVFPSHGIGLGGVSILEKTLDHRLVRENQILTLSKEGLDPQQMLEKIYAEVDRRLWPYALMNIQKHLVKLKLDGLL
ncbi:MAG TPA: MBL fold metallo-hydrolase [Bacteriovoracaceae bacterium]|nr:MBL fold metallo-hydrolase [Bacteriovoracaceae bacterium]